MADKQKAKADEKARAAKEKWASTVSTKIAAQILSLSKALADPHTRSIPAVITESASSAYTALEDVEK